ncbi:hypothetical protein Tco_1250382 [Tanacetum coccineum]
MHFLLSSMSVVYMLTTPIPKDGENATVEQLRKRAKWDNDDYVYRGLIHNGMFDPLFDIYQNVKSSKELWDSLEAKYMVEDASSKKFLKKLIRRTLYSQGRDGSRNCSNHYYCKVSHSQVQDYALWDVIENGNSFKPVAQTTTNADGTSTSLIPSPVTTEEKVQKKNDVKARSMLLMALPNEHLMIFNQYKDAKTLFAAIQTRLGGFRRFPVSTQVSTASTQLSTANLSDDTVYAFLASQPNGSQLVYEDLEQIHEDDIEEMDLKWQLSLLSMRTRRIF